MKIRNQINLSILAAFVPLAIIMVFIVSFFGIRLFSAELKNRLNILSIDHAENIRVYLNGQKQIVSNLAASQVMRDFLYLSIDSDDYQNQKSRTESRLIRTLAANSDIYEFSLLDKKGVVAASTDKTQVGQDKSDNLCYTQGQKKIYIRDIHFSEVILDYSYEISAPIISDQTGAILGVIVARFKVDYLNSLLANHAGLGKTGEIFLVNFEKYLITPSLYLGKEKILKQKIETQNVKECFSPEEIREVMENGYNEFHQGHQPVINYTDYRFIKVVGTHAYIPEVNWCLVTKIDQKELFKPISQIILFLGFIVILVILLLVLVGTIIAKKITKPLEELHHGTEIVEQGNLDYLVGIKAKNEIGQLSQSFDKMTSAIKKSRAEIDLKVAEQTKDIFEKQKYLEDQQKAVLNILEDIEEEKENVSKEKDKINAILQSIGDGVFVVDNDLKITMFNQVAADISGFSIKEAVGKSYYKVLNFIYEKDKKINDKFVKDAISTGQVQEMSNHTLLIRKDKTQLAVADSAAPLKDKSGKVIGCVVVFRDVTKEREIDKMKTEFVSLASHQLRTPLSAIKWFLEMVLNGDAGKINEEQKEYLQQAFDSNKRMVKLVNDLLNVSRLEMGRLAVDPTPSDLIKLCQTLVSELTPLINANNLKFKFNKPQKLPQINLDQKLISQVVGNFLSNAIKYSKGGGNIELLIEVLAKDIKVSVKDSGLGIPKNQQNKIFEKFFRADNVTTADTEGTGLGLYVAKKVIEVSGGQIGFSSVENKGSTFWFTLPLSGSKKVSGEKTLENTVNLKK